MPTATGRAFTTANFLANLAALKAINFGSSDPNGTWFIVPNQTTNNVEIWVWEPTSTATTNEIDVVRPDSIVSNTPGRCIQRLKFDASSLGGILAAIAALNTAGLIERTAAGSAAIVGLGAFGRSFLGSTNDSGARTALGLDQINNTSDANKPVSTLQLTALNLKANLASPTFTGTPFVPTATAGTNTTQAASTAFVTTGLALKANLVSPTFTGTPSVPTAVPGTNTTQAASTAFVATAVASLVGSSPTVLDTLGELATALGNDPNFATTIIASLATKAPSNSPVFTGLASFANAIYASQVFNGYVSNTNNKSLTDTDFVNPQMGKVFNFIGTDYTPIIDPGTTWSGSAVDVSANGTVNLTSISTGAFFRFRHLGTSTLTTAQGVRLIGLNFSTGNVTNLTGAYFAARNDSTGSVTNLIGGEFVATSASAGIATTLLGGKFTASITNANATTTTLIGGQFIVGANNTVPATIAIGVDIPNITGTAITKIPLRVGTGGSSYFNDTTVSTSPTTGALIVAGVGVGGGNIFATGNIQGTQFQVGGVKVLGARDTGWTTGTGTPNKGSFAADTATLLQVSQRLLAFEQMARAMGFIN